MRGIGKLLDSCLARGRGGRVRSLRRLAGGANSLAWRVVTDGGEVLLAKLYRRHPGDEADRLEVEFGGLSFLWAHGVRDVPEPVCMSPGDRVGFYAFLPGRKLGAGRVGAGHVEQAADFLRTLHGLARTPEARALPAAREACFSLRAHLDLVRGRLARLASLPSPAGSYARLAGLVRDGLAPHLRAVSDRVAREAPDRGIDPEAVLPPGKRTLSPSDFGFHNAVLRPGGRLAFVDFEYWGWDDPAKTVADFWLQPEVPVPAELRRPFLDRVSAFLDRDDLARRLPLVHPLLALKWCLIMLNPFLRREPAPGGDALLEERLARAGSRLEEARGEFARRGFPLDLPPG